MAQTIKIKRTTGNTKPDNVAQGELFYAYGSGGTYGKRLSIGNVDGGGNTPEIIGGSYYTAIIDAATNANTASTVVKRDGSGNFAAGTITAALSGNASTATALETSRTIALTGDATASGSFDGSANYSQALTLATVNSNVGSFGSTTAVPVITVNAKGLVTAVSTSAIATSFDVAADSGTTDTVAGGETLTLTGGTGVSTTVGSNEVTFAIGQAVGTSDNVQFNNVTVDGTLTSDDLTSTNISVAGNATITGNLTVSGTTTTVNSNTVNIGDNILILNSDETGTPSQDGGFEVERGTSTNVSFFWDESEGYFAINDASTTSKVLTAGNFAASFTGTIDGGTYPT